MQLPRGDINWFRGLAVYVSNGFSVYRQHSNKCGCCKVIVIRICSSSYNFYTFGVYRNPDLSNKSKTFDSLTAMVKVHVVDKKASFLFVGDTNAYHEE